MRHRDHTTVIEVDVEAPQTVAVVTVEAVGAMEVEVMALVVVVAKEEAEGVKAEMDKVEEVMVMGAAAAVEVVRRKGRHDTVRAESKVPPLSAQCQDTSTRTSTQKEWTQVNPSAYMTPSALPTGRCDITPTLAVREGFVAGLAAVG